jgi:hypothetical protein
MEVHGGVVYTGTAFDLAHLFKWLYNDRSELTSADRFEETNPADPGDPMTPGDVSPRPTSERKVFILASLLIVVAHNS